MKGFNWNGVSYMERDAFRLPRFVVVFKFSLEGDLCIVY